MATNFEGRRQTAQWWHLRKKTAVVKVTSYKTSQGLAISVLIKRWAFPSIIVTLSCWVSHLWCLVLDNLKNMNPIAPPGCLKMTSLSQKHTKKITKKRTTHATLETCFQTPSKPVASRSGDGWRAWRTRRQSHFFKLMNYANSCTCNFTKMRILDTIFYTNAG